MSDAPPERGEPTALDVEALRRRLARAVHRTCPAWLVSHADDIVQSAVLRVMGALSKREGNPGVATLYLEKAAFAATADEIRRLRRRREVPAEPEALARAVDAASAGPDRQLLAREIRSGVADCLSRLPEDRRAAVTLYLQGHTMPEAGGLLGWSGKKAENMVYRGLADLRRCLARKGLAR
jgi:RNA polymerase sigma-70 factor (ECF subfamily)